MEILKEKSKLEYLIDMIKDMNIKYERETVYDDKIKVYAQVEKTEQGIVTIHKIISTVNEKELTRVEIRWE